MNGGYMLQPQPEKSVKQIAQETLSTDVVRTGNRYWTELTLAMLVGHYFGSQHGYLMLVGMGAAAIGADILLNIIRENLKTSSRVLTETTEDGKK